MPIAEAKKTGAVAMFNEKYGDIVRVVRMGDFSLEFCGGTHVSNVSQIGLIKLISEGSISSGVRRVEALAGPTAWEFINEQLTYLADAANLLKTSPVELAAQIDRLKEQLKDKERLAQSLQGQLATAKIPSLLEQAKLIGDLSVVVSDLSPSSADDLRTIAQELLKHKPKSVVLLASSPEKDKVALACAVDSSLTSRDINAGAIVKLTAGIVGGSGGGRPDFAQAGGKYPAKIKEALDAGLRYIIQQSEGQSVRKAADKSPAN
jgi:alanyl-tRNA synthetase